ncbi:MAG: VOC family protein [Chloroflexota bacterium]|jgi:lactoylglutathione lyase
MFAGTVQGFQHLGLPVTDMARSRAFYERLGFRAVFETALPAEGGAIEVAMLDLNGFVLELYQLTGADLDEVAARGDGHVDHLALNVADIEQAWEAARAAGLTPLEEAPMYLPFWGKGCKYFTVRGPDGEKVEFNQILG